MAPRPARKPVGDVIHKGSACGASLTSAATPFINFAGAGLPPPLTRAMAEVCPVGPGGVALTPPAASYITGAPSTAPAASTERGDLPRLRILGYRVTRCSKRAYCVSDAGGAPPAVHHPPRHYLRCAVRSGRLAVVRTRCDGARCDAGGVRGLLGGRPGGTFTGSVRGIGV